MSPLLGTLRTLLPQELWMQLRQQMTVLMVVLLPVAGLPAALAGTAAYMNRVDEVEQATRPDRRDGDGDASPREPGAPPAPLRVSVPDEVTAWIREDDGLEVVPPDRALARLVLEGRRATVFHAPTMASTQAGKRLARVARRRANALRKEALEAAGIPSGRGDGLVWRSEDRGGAAPSGGALILPATMLLMLMTAAFTALDVLTGERERGTLETLLTTAADRRGVILAKTLVVAIATLATGWMGIVGVVLAGALGAPGAPALTAAQALGMAGAVALLAVFAASLAVVLAIGAPNYRSASLAMGAVLLVPALPAGLGVFPIELTPAMAMMPIGNVSLAARDALAGTLTAADALLVGVVSLVWAGVAVAATIGRVGSEGALLQAHDPAAFRRAGFFGREAAGVFGLMLLLVWVVGTPVQAVDLRAGVWFTEVALIAGVAVAGVVWVGLPLRETLSLRAPSWRDLALAGIAGAGAPGVAMLALVAQEPVFPMPPSLAEALTGLGQDLGWVQAMVLIALLPAVCEEIAFRGALLGMMRRSPLVVRLGANALMFGAIHLSVHRMLPTAALGLLIAVAAVRSRSLAVPVIVHLLNNGLAVSAAGWLGLEEGPGTVVAAGMAAASIGAVAAMGRRSGPT